MIEVKFYDKAADDLLKFAVIIARQDGKWIFCKHKQRDTYELPGGHRESGETILEAARRELQEETGAIDFAIEPVCVYSVKGENKGQPECRGRNLWDAVCGRRFLVGGNPQRDRKNHGHRASGRSLDIPADSAEIDCRSPKKRILMRIFSLC